MRPARALSSMFKPAMVSEYGKKGADAESTRWRLFKVFTHVVTIGCGIGLILAQEYPGSSATGEHAMSGVQRWTKRMYAGIVTGDFSPPPALTLPERRASGCGPSDPAAGGAAAAAGQDGSSLR